LWVQAERKQSLEKILTPAQLEQLNKMRLEKGSREPGKSFQGMKQIWRNGQQRAMMPQSGDQNGQQRAMMPHPGERNGQNMEPKMEQDCPMLTNRDDQNCPMMTRNAGGKRLGMNAEEPGRFSNVGAQRFDRQAKRKGVDMMVNPEERIKNQVERMTKQLDLSPEQTAKIQDIQKKYAKKEIARYQKVQKKMDVQKKTRDARLNEIKSVLTDDQVKKLEALKEKNQQMQKQEGPMFGRK